MRARGILLLLIAALAAGYLQPAAQASEADMLHAVRIVVDGDVHWVAARLENGDWYVHPDELPEPLSAPAGGGDWISLRSVAQAMDIAYDFDGDLQAAYLWTAEPYGRASTPMDYRRAFDLGLVPEDMEALDPSAAATSGQFRALLLGLVERCAPDQVSYFTQKVSTHEMPLLRFQAYPMVFYAAIALGLSLDNQNSQYSYGGDWPTLFPDIFSGDYWSGDWQSLDPLYPDALKEEEPIWVNGLECPSEGNAAMMWMVTYKSNFSDRQIIAYDFFAESMRNQDSFTVEDAICAVARLYDCIPKDFEVELNNPLVTQADPSILYPELLKQAVETAVTRISQLPQLKGFVFPITEEDFAAGGVLETEGLIRDSANWGYNCVRLNLRYESFFTDEKDKPGLTVNYRMLQRLDRLVAAAIRSNIHLNICLESLPGRWYVFDYEDRTSVASLDLFIDPVEQEKVLSIWDLLAQRYQEVPGSYLSFTPFWEADNTSLSTGLEPPDYDMEDIVALLERIIQTVLERDGDRFLFAEVGLQPDTEQAMKEIHVLCDPVMEEYASQVQISHNWAQKPFVYANICTVTPGMHIDMNNHGMFRPEYPTEIYGIGVYFDTNQPFMMTGGIPAGTQFDLYLADSDACTLTISSDSEVLYTEDLSDRSYETSNKFSEYYPYATSEKKISVTLKKDTETLAITVTSPTGDTRFVHWAGMDLLLPESYAVERWYFPTEYDAHLAGTEKENVSLKETSRIMLCPNCYERVYEIRIDAENVTYESDVVAYQANAGIVENYAALIEEYAPAGALVRFEQATGSRESVYRYYDDTIKSLDAHGLSWLDNDFFLAISLYNESFNVVGGAELVQYRRHSCFNLELFQFLQSRQGHLPTLSARLRQETVTALVLDPGFEDTAGYVAAAAYDADGRMVDSALSPVTLEAFVPSAVELRLDTESASSVKVFYLDQNYAPVTEVQVLEVGL